MTRHIPTPARTAPTNATAMMCCAVQSSAPARPHI